MAKMINGSKINLPIKFYLYDKYLGIGFITEGSDSKQRKEAARKVGILYYNGIIIQNRDLRNFRIKLKDGKIIRAIDFNDLTLLHSVSCADPRPTCKERKLAWNKAFKRHLQLTGTRLIKYTPNKQ